MNLFKHIPVLAIVAMLALIVGCSGGSTPLTPGSSDISDNAPIVGLAEADGMYTMIGLLGAYEVNVDLDNHTAELVAKRDAAIGEGYIVSGINFFTMAPCTSCLQLVGLDLIPGEALILSFSIQHPFAPGNTAEPPTAANRLDLDVFDVAAVIAPHEATEFNFPLTGASIYSDLAANPDGYTKELQALLNDNNALPYFLVIDDNADEADTWNKLAMGASTEFDIDFSLTSGGFSFDMYLTFGYGFSARRLQRLTPKYFNPEFNRNAAWKVKVVPPGPAEMGFTWQDNDDTMEYGVEVHVWDWQQGATIYGDPADFENAPNNNIYASSDVASVSVEIIGMTSTLPSETVPDSGTGTPDDPLVYIIPITNENLLAPGQYSGLVKVLDDRAPGTIGERDFMINTPDGILLDNYAIPEFATYQSFVADVVQGCGPLELISITGCPTEDIDNNTIVNFEVLADSPLGGMPITYEIDTNYDGETFNPDPDYPANETGVFDVLFYDDPCVEGTSYDIAFRLTDSCDPSNVLVIDDACTVTIGMCCPDVVIDQCVPDTVGIWDPHTIEIQGSGFVDGPDLEVEWIPEAGHPCRTTPGSHFSTTVQVIDSNTIRASFGDIYARDCWYVWFYYDVKVTNGCGLSDTLERALYMDF